MEGKYAQWAKSSKLAKRWEEEKSSILAQINKSGKNCNLGKPQLLKSTFLMKYFQLVTGATPKAPTITDRGEEKIPKNVRF